MGRIIKFRGKNKSGKWIFGDLVHNRGWVYIAPPGLRGPLAKAEDFEVDENTVGQFVGIKDKDDTDIYEGDIVKHGDEISAVLYDEEYCEFYFFASDCEIDSRCSKEYTVIGNIFDNPKLLKGE
jgi:uncharacterized phage protein (TIGR01671 family)